jgi:hypothetical protein
MFPEGGPLFQGVLKQPFVFGIIRFFHSAVLEYPPGLSWKMPGFHMLIINADPLQEVITRGQAESAIN